MIMTAMLNTVIFAMPLQFSELRLVKGCSTTVLTAKPGRTITTVRDFQQVRLNRPDSIIRLDTPTPILAYCDELTDVAALELVRLNTSPYTYDLFAPPNGLFEVEVSEAAEYHSWRFGFQIHDRHDEGINGRLGHEDWVRHKLTKPVVRRTKDGSILVDRWLVRQVKGSGNRCQLVKVRDIINRDRKQLVRVDLQQGRDLPMKLFSFADDRVYDILALGKRVPTCIRALSVRRGIRAPR